MIMKPLIYQEGGALIKAWVNGVQLEEQAKQQLINTSKLPFIYKHLAVMPDVHWGMGATIGSVIATKGAIIPAAVGVDIGCGMMAIKTSLHANDLPDNLFELRSELEKAIPHGRTNNGGSGDRGAWCDLPERNINAFKNLYSEYEDILLTHPKLTPRINPAYHLGTLGTGNHFVELCLDQNNDVWVMLHSGSRGIGNKIGTYFIEKAKEEMRKYYIDKNLPDIDLAYLVEHTVIYQDYIFAVGWAQKFALMNREIMMSNIYDVLRKYFPRISFDEIESTVKAINCHHNYVSWEHHFGQDVIVTRKGAVRAMEGDLGIIPGSMGAKSFIVRGKGDPDSFHSCSHGAGRSMSRGDAKRKFTVADHIKATEGVECRKDEEVVDETPGAYKDIDAVMKAQEDLVEIIYTLKQVLCIKG